MHHDVTQFGTIGVLMGGYSSERDISLKSGRAVYQALKEAGCRVSGLDILFREEKEILSFLKEAKIDVAFIALHGSLGEDGTIQTILEELAIPYSGSGVEASRQAINKIQTQTILKRENIPVAEHVIVKNGLGSDGRDLRRILRHLSFPVVVKPAAQGSSIGVTLVDREENLKGALKTALRYGPEALVERCIPGREFTVGILGEEVLPVIELCPKNRFFDFEAKYQPGMTDYIVPARVPLPVSHALQDAAWGAHRALGCEDLSRVDIMLDEGGSPYVLEVNTIPGFTQTSLLPKAALAAGMDFVQLCLRLVGMAYDKKKK